MEPGDSAIYGLNNKEKIERLREKRINSLKSLLSSIKLGMLKLDGIDWKKLITFFIDRIEVHSLGRINKTSKLDVYVHYNFNSLAAENIGKITPRWVNQGGGSLSVGCINPEKIVPILAGINDNPINVDLTFKKKIKVI